MHFLRGKRGQLALVIIVGLVVIAGVIFYFLVRSEEEVVVGERDFSPIYDAYSECIRQAGSVGVSLLGTQGGRLDSGTFEPGSSYMPFSSHFNFLGFPIRYWYYVSANGVQKEQLPTRGSMEQELSAYIEESMADCDLDVFRARGYSISVGDVSVKSVIEHTAVVLDVESALTASIEGETGRKEVFEVSIPSKLGSLYAQARSIYQAEKQKSFLENYSADVLQLYAPVDGVEISCSGKVWKTQEVVKELQQGLSANIASLKLKGGYYTLADKSRKYFVVDVPSSESVQFSYDPSWPTAISIYGEGVSESLLIAEPQGAEAGLGVLGFCYAPYHFVYDVAFPVLVQVYDEQEVFQFPVAVVIDKNVPRSGALSTITNESEVDVCAFPTQDVVIHLKDSQLGVIDGNVSYQCFTQRCRLGASNGGVFVGKIPACVNGRLMASSSGYRDVSQLFSSNSESEAELLLDREYPVTVSVRSGGKVLSGTVLVSFVSGETSKTIALPETESVSLSESEYSIRVLAYGSSNITIPASSKTECTEIAQGGLFGLFGGTKEECYTINLPATTIESALSAGGSGNEYLLGSSLEGGKLVIDVPSFKKPTTLEELQNSYALFESAELEVSYA